MSDRPTRSRPPRRRISKAWREPPSLPREACRGGERRQRRYDSELETPDDGTGRAPDQNLENNPMQSSRWPSRCLARRRQPPDHRRTEAGLSRHWHGGDTTARYRSIQISLLSPQESAGVAGVSPFNSMPAIFHRFDVRMGHNRHEAPTSRSRGSSAIRPAMSRSLRVNRCQMPCLMPGRKAIRMECSSIGKTRLSGRTRTVTAIRAVRLFIEEFQSARRLSARREPQA